MLNSSSCWCLPPSSRVEEKFRAHENSLSDRLSRRRDVHLGAGVRKKTGPLLGIYGNGREMKPSCRREMRIKWWLSLSHWMIPKKKAIQINSPDPVQGVNTWKGQFSPSALLANRDRPSRFPFKYLPSAWQTKVFSRQEEDISWPESSPSRKFPCKIQNLNLLFAFLVAKGDT